MRPSEQSCRIQPPGDEGGGHHQGPRQGATGVENRQVGVGGIFPLLVISNDETNSAENCGGCILVFTCPILVSLKSSGTCFFLVCRAQPSPPSTIRTQQYETAARHLWIWYHGVHHHINRQAFLLFSFLDAEMFNPIQPTDERTALIRETDRYLLDRPQRRCHLPSATVVVAH